MTRQALAVALACAAFRALAQDSPAARSLAATCAACHGTDGRSTAQEIASLAGMPREHIASQMRAFRDGKSAATVMQQIAKGYSDQQIDLVADYLSRRAQ